MKHLLLFDLDWTLIYTGGAGIRALNHAFEKQFGVANAMKAVSPDGKTDPAICREMVRVHLGRPAADEEIGQLCRGYLDQLALEIPHGLGYRILPGISELLEALVKRADVMLGLGTGNLEEGARIKLARADFMKYFSFGGFGSDAEARPEVLRTGVRRGEAIAERKFHPHDVFVIGDNRRDVEAGKAIGATTVAVASGPMSFEELEKTSPDFIFHDLSNTAEVLEVLTRHVSKV